MRDDYILAARKVIDDPYILVNVVSRRVKQLRRGARSLVESLEKLSPEDIALREIIEGKISYELAVISKEESATPDRLSNRPGHERNPEPVRFATEAKPATAPASAPAATT